MKTLPRLPERSIGVGTEDEAADRGCGVDLRPLACQDTQADFPLRQFFHDARQVAA